MKKRLIFSLALTLGLSVGAWGQRAMDVLDRGLVAVKTSTGAFCSWRINAEEWYDVKYNIYRDGTKLNSAPLSVSNYSDPAGTASSKYTVAAVVDGKEQAKSAASSVLANNYLEIVPQHAAELQCTYVPNDATIADVDGDGQMELLMKYDNSNQYDNYHDGVNGEFTLIECLRLDGTVLWWINCGPNLGDFQNNEINIIGYDWDGDGKAEVVFRAADGTKIHQADGTVYTVGDASINYRAASAPDGQWFMHSGKEYLLYMDGLTGKPYQCIDYPLARLEPDENPNGLLSGSAYDALVNTAWGDGYGHRSSKYFFGAPFFDGRKPSIFLGRGIYTRHKMIAYDVDPATHQLIERWRWNSPGGAWQGQGYHNYTVADVDMDGRDEIVWGSMVIDDNGQGLSTSGLGHGDSHHVGDFDPYTPGLEFFGCNEDEPNNNFRDATTSKIYYRSIGGRDDGRANMGNFIDKYPGAEGISSRDDALIGCASHKAIIGDTKGSVSLTQNFRIFWDGDLLEETQDYGNGKNTAIAIYKARTGKLTTLTGSKTNNDTKGTPCLQADIFGDWREEVVTRDANNHIRIYTTDIPTPWRAYSLLADHQYRNAVVWQMCGYNQTPHVSYYWGEMEGYTEAPAPLTMNGRTEIANGGTINASAKDKHVIMCETNDMAVTVASGAAPKILTISTPSWTQGHGDNDNITTTYSTHALNGAALTGAMRLIKQGEGKLTMAKNTHTYSGETKIWGGTVEFDGTLQNSRVWMNRHTSLTSNGGNFAKGVRMEYGSQLTIGTASAAGTVTTDTLALAIGAKVNFDLFASNGADKLVAKVLKIETKDWLNGPEYQQPIFYFTGRAAELANGKYLIGEVGKIEGDIANLLIEGIYDKKVALSYEGGKLYANLQNYESAAKTWTGATSGVWNLDSEANFALNAGGASAVFVPGDDLTFDDSASTTDITLVGKLMPKSVTFANNEKAYTLGGDGRILGSTGISITGTGTVAINNANEYTGGTNIAGGKLIAGSLANEIGTDYGALGAVSNPITMRNGATLSTAISTTAGQTITLAGGHGTIEVPEGMTLTLTTGVKQNASDQVLTKEGAGTLKMAGGNTASKLVISHGIVSSTESDLPKTVEFGENGTLDEPCTMYTYTTSNTNYVVPEGMKGTLYLDGRCNYKGTLTGSGEFSVVATESRNVLQGNWSEFAGTINVLTQKRGSYDPWFSWDNSYGIGKALLNVPGGYTFDAGSRNVQIGNVKGSGTVKTSGVIYLGGRNEEITFAGTFDGNPTINKVGTGEWKLSKALTTVKGLNVEGGTLSINASKESTNIYPREIEVSGDSTVITGRGAVGGIVVSNGAILRPGAYSSGAYYAALTTQANSTVQASGRIYVREGATVDFYIRKADGATNSQSQIKADGALQLNGTIQVHYDHKYNFQDGDEITLWTAKSFSGTPTFDLEPLPGGQTWDTSGLTGTTGVIKVVGTNSLASVESDLPADCYVYTISGIYAGKVVSAPSKVTETLRTAGYASGIYVVKTGTATIKVVL